MLILGVGFTKNGKRRFAWKYVSVPRLIRHDPSEIMAHAIARLDPFQRKRKG